MKAKFPELTSDDIRMAAEKYEWLRRNLNVFSSHRPSAMEGWFSSGKHDSDYQNAMENLVLEVTRACNLRCKYCSYSDYYPNKRNYKSETMSLQTAIKAVDFFAKHIEDTPTPGISFFGGEPFLNFPIIKATIEHARRVMSNKSLSFHLTTNGTLIRDDILPFLVENDVALVFSLDGPSHCHDSNRISIGGEPTFERIMKGLLMIRDRYGAYYENKVRFQSVVAPNQSLDDTNQFFTALRENLGGIDQLNLVNTVSDVQTDYWYFNKPSDRWIESYESLRWKYYESLVLSKQSVDPFLHRIFGPVFDRIHRREYAHQLPETLWMNACCVPCVKKLYVDAHGQFHICEGASNTFPVGDINYGINFAKIRQLEDDFITKSMPDCKQCWAVRLCTICFAHVLAKGSIDLDTKKSACILVRDHLARALIDYCEIAEINPNAFEKLKVLT
jgi:uncharacterized protein